LSILPSAWKTFKRGFQKQSSRRIWYRSPDWKRNKVTGVVLSDQVKSLDWKIRNAEFCDKLPEAVILEILKKLETLLNFNE